MKIEYSEEFSQEKKNALEDLLGYTFRDTSLLLAAVTHLSYINESGQAFNQSYERLEFLGDAVLQMLISDTLFKKFPAFKEGELSRFRAHLVLEENLADIARQYEIGQFILLGKGEIQGNGRQKSSILSDVVEALIGAVYVDSYAEHGVEKVKTLLERWFSPSINRLEGYRIVKNSRSMLYELSEKNKWKNLEFRCIDESGLDHNKIYTYEIWIDEKAYGKGIAGSKKLAARIAAEKTLIMMGYEVR